MKLNNSSLIFILSALVALGPLSIDMYLPSIPEIATFFGTKIHQAELTVSIFFLGFGIGQFIGGPFSDNIGRKPITLIGLIIFAIASLMITFSTQVEWMILFRFFQAVGGGFVTVNASAIVRDQFEASESAKILSSVASIMMIAPMVAPLLGSFVVKFGEWQYIFAFLTCYAIIMLLAVKILLNIKTREKSKISISQITKSYLSVFKHKQGMGYLLSGSFASTGMFAFITKSSYIYIEYFKLSSDIFPLCFGANVLLMIILSKTSGKLVHKYHPSKIMKAGLTLNIIAGVMLFTYTSLMTPAFEVVLGLNILFVGSLGLVYGNVDACCLSYFPKNAGVANALFGITKFGLGATAGAVIGIVGGNAISGPFAVMMGASILSNLFYYILAQSKSRTLELA
ncbi:multidrug effflux MFS transporter [Limibacter armeniacum]|uniref:multidrug effflux MFS transporter n=1 Tax=Limibacter armeniacum TaxID=466084 RepID=UPI002FE67840